MITVNLLPFELRPIKRTPVPYIASAAIFLVILAIIGSVWLRNVGELNASETKLSNHRKELKDLEPIVTEANELAEKESRLAEQVQAIREISSDRIVWSLQLYNLSRLAMDNLWYENIRDGVNTYTETQTVYNPQTKKTTSKKVRVKRPVLIVEGYVVPGADGQSSVSPFTLATESDEEFSAMFQLDLSTFKDTYFDDVPVRQFQLEYLITPGGKAE